ncbi:MAG TPA: MerR family transcriptional regulator, partial [Clostridia bacterium]|nr:MerR family transcriptional regulator [Clostridia bacterium]
MNLIKITDLTARLSISSRSLRYYEQAGLIRSVRTDFEKYRYYDEPTVERLKQILVLRKMEIPIKDILRIYENEDMSVVVETFVNRLRAIDDEVDALEELRGVVDEFLQAMLRNGVTKISALPILYERMEKRIDLTERKRSLTYAALSDLSERLARPVEASILHLPPMRVLSSRLGEDPDASDPEGFWHWAQTHGLAPGEPGRHEQFEYQTAAGEVVVLRVPDDFENSGPYADYAFGGGLFAAANVYLDEDVGERFRALVSGFDNNPYYEIDYRHGGGLRHEALVENLIAPDERRELVSLLVPVKKRLADPKLFGQPEELDPGSVTIEAIERANPVLWSVDVVMDRLIPINRPHYRVTEAGEAEFISWISTRVLSTNAAVKLPFRVDVEFRVGEESGGWGHGRKEGSIRFHHGDDLNYLFGINMDNDPDERLSQEAICFHQPIFGDYFRYPKRGAIELAIRPENIRMAKTPSPGALAGVFEQSYYLGDVNDC